MLARIAVILIVTMVFLVFAATVLKEANGAVEARCPAQAVPYEPEQHHYFAVFICEPPLDFERVPLGILIGSQQFAHGTYWILSFKSLKVYSVPFPPTQKDFDAFDEKGFSGILKMQDVPRSMLPPIFQNLPPEVQDLILGFFQYPNGAYEIYLLPDTRESAEALACALNGKERGCIPLG